MGNYVHSKQFYAATKRREINRLLDSYGYDRKPSPAQQRLNEAVAAVRFTKRGGHQHPVNDLPHDKHAADFKYAIDEQRHAMTMFPESKSIGEALSKWYGTEMGKRVLSERLRDNYKQSQLDGALGDGAPGTDQLIYGPQWRPAVQSDSPRPIGTANPAVDGTLSAGPNVGSRSAADGTPPAASSAYVGKLDREMIGAIGKQVMAGVYAKVRKQLVAMDQWPEDWIDSALVRYERGQ
jgi:hypothetical protein